MLIKSGCAATRPLIQRRLVLSARGAIAVYSSDIDDDVPLLTKFGAELGHDGLYYLLLSFTESTAAVPPDNKDQ